MRKGFTLIELLAVIVILAIIALIAIPIILGIINDSKEQSIKLSVENYLRAVELSVSREYVNNPTVNSNVLCEIVDGSNGKKIKCGTSEPIPVEFEGEGLTTGMIELSKSEVKQLIIGEINNVIVIYSNGQMKLFNGIKTLVSGQEFNKKIKKLANGISMSTSTSETTITSIEFYSNEKLPEGYTKANLKELRELGKFVDVSLDKDGSILAYYDSGKVYITSDSLISLNENCSEMFYNFDAVTGIQFREIDTSKVTSMGAMFYQCDKLISIDVSNFNTVNVNSMHRMFGGCLELNKLDVSNFNTSKVTNMTYMFSKTSLTSLDLSKWDTSKATNTSYMFAYSGSLKPVFIGEGWVIGELTDTTGMFSGCKTTSVEQLCEPNSTEEWCVVSES